MGTHPRFNLFIVSTLLSILLTSDAYCGFGEAVSAFQKGDYKAAYDEFKPLAEQGNAEAQDYLGYMYQNGLGVRQDYAEAAKWFRKSAEQGYALGQNNLGTMYQNGFGVPKDFAEALKWYRKAAEHRGWLGVMIQDNTPELAQAFGTSEAKGVIVADVVPGSPAERGGLKGGDIVQTLNGNQVENAGQLSRSVYSMSPGTLATIEVIRDGKPESINFSIGETGLAAAQANLGSMYLNGQGVPKDYAKAIKWYRKAADQKSAYAQGSLGWMYQNGLGVQKDDAEAVRWYRMAADQGNAAAQYSLGLAFENGRGVPRNEAEALEWYRKAADQGFAEAQKKLDMYAARSTEDAMMSGSDVVNLLPESKDIRVSAKMAEYCESYRIYKKRIIPDSRLESFPNLKGKGVSTSPVEATLYIEFLSEEAATTFIQCLDGPWNRIVPRFAEIFMIHDDVPGLQRQVGVGNWHPQHVILHDKDGDFIPLLNPQNSGGGYLFFFASKNPKQPFPWQDQRIYDRLDKLGQKCTGR